MNDTDAMVAMITALRRDWFRGREGWEQPKIITMHPVQFHALLGALEETQFLLRVGETATVFGMTVVQDPECYIPRIVGGKEALE